MVQANIIRGFLNRLRDRGFKNFKLKAYTDNEIQILKRGDKFIVAVETIVLDPSVDIMPQAEAFFRNLIELIEHGTAKEIFLPGDGDISIPSFFKDWCDNNAVKIQILSLDNHKDFYHYN